MKNNSSKIVEKEKIVAEKLNGRFAMLGFIALIGAYLTTGQIIPGFIQKNIQIYKISEFFEIRSFYKLTMVRISKNIDTQIILNTKKFLKNINIKTVTS